MKAKLKRCSEPGCRTLTATTYCPAHDEPEEVAEAAMPRKIAAPKPRPKFDAEAFIAAWLERCTEAARARAAEADEERRQRLFGLKRHALAQEQPRFRHG